MPVLVVKLSSMGDLVQTLPALSDALGRQPEIRFHWVADRAFAEIAAWHPAVESVIESAHRSWRKSPLQALRHEIPTFRHELRQHDYKLIIDVQANLKSAAVTRLARGQRAGMDAGSVREWGAQFAYAERFAVPKNLHAITRTRSLFAQALGYDLPTSRPDFSMPRERLAAITIPAFNSPFVVFMQHATWTSKLWQARRWRELCQLATAAGYTVALPWGNEDERLRSEVLATDLANVNVLPKLSINEIAALILKSAGCISTDTGLAHIAAGLDTPTVTLYGATDPARIGATGARTKHLCGSGFEIGAPGAKRKIGPGAAAFTSLPALSAQKVWAAFTALTA